MKINIPDKITLTCPSCDSDLFSIDNNEIATCSTCNLQLHKDELIEQNNIADKLDTTQIAKDLAQEIKKIFKGNGWK
ncbi:ECs_2282 family putative zinc-binding protein [Acinetobacter wuhouensis]|uniref:Uncharacterized protein n=1 Tax=Acinetobacter wuhouensis TaxID=1879050 RepID=A0A4V2DNF4_9GAMM|nr:hypothetical protein [Acinetobacter wuhouensis]RZG48485.1 hypothetical protein EXU28_03965 [Acinetobacter wuhouensis]